MRSFSSTELANKTGDVLAAAAAAPVVIKRHGKARFVILSIERYDRLTAGHDTRRAFHVSDLSDAEAEELVKALEHSIAHD
ncbi:type II toxin-antitoxin system prevent-host-death family antitoxin [Paenirhodobacter sp. CAU 1674]|uniref:type II toxin-antitoxin system prevent-host-death family antitoxin n=1 Tax=Paenirhodobacter sp. CAU 1674 TaxID=3032596 RepID=UPI0023DB50E4|nr:type II toxin-antitoxin system prevent-host-death family antitoxin [Paenirhodobacter sp. CAU 1674]MDF2143286.1 type II toxin-antitoxin system prevent-host-death family antitoxin [Paenirhodobacter sp. CAU 1674]